LNLEWIKEIDYRKHLTGDLAELEKIIGIDNLIKILEYFGKTAIYISEKPILEMKKEYIRKHYGKIGAKELARKLGISERLVYEIGNEKVTCEKGLFDGE